MDVGDYYIISDDIDPKEVSRILNQEGIIENVTKWRDDKLRHNFSCTIEKVRSLKSEHGLYVIADTSSIHPKLLLPYSIIPLVPLVQQKTSNKLVSYYTWAACLQCKLTTRHCIINPDDCAEKAEYTCMWNNCGKKWGMGKEFYNLWQGCNIEPGDDRMVYPKCSS